MKLKVKVHPQVLSVIEIKKLTIQPAAFCEELSSLAVDYVQQFH